VIGRGRLPNRPWNRIEHLDTKTDGSFRKVPLPGATTQLLWDYLAVHLNADIPTAPLFPAVSLEAQKPDRRTCGSFC
jgi:hypothetical protein